MKLAGLRRDSSALSAVWGSRVARARFLRMWTWPLHGSESGPISRSRCRDTIGSVSSARDTDQSRQHRQGLRTGSLRRTIDRREDQRLPIAWRQQQCIGPRIPRVVAPAARLDRGRAIPCGQSNDWAMCIADRALSTSGSGTQFFMHEGPALRPYPRPANWLACRGRLVGQRAGTDRHGSRRTINGPLCYGTPSSRPVCRQRPQIAVIMICAATGPED